MRRYLLPLLSVTLVSIVASSVAWADSANNVVRFGLGWLDPDADTTVDTGGTNVHISADNATAYFVDYERRLIPWLGLDFQVMYAEPDFTATPVAGGPATTQAEKTLTGSGGVNFHIFARSRIDFYVGAYAAWTTFDETFDDAFGYGGLIGLDVGITKSGLVVTGSVRYTKTDADFSTVSGASAPYDPILYQLGLGWRF